jgi:hypothetical protein
MYKRNFLITFLKKLNLIINNLLKENLNKLNLNNFRNIAKSNKIFFTFVALIVLSLTYFSIPITYDKDEISRELQNQLQNKLSLKFNLSKNVKYNFLPQPHFVYKNSTILMGHNKISQIRDLKIYISLNNLFSLNNTKINNLILENSNININKENYDFFSQLLNQDFKNINLIIKDSNIFYRNKNNQVLFINKVKKMKYYYDVKDFKNVLESKNEIFNLPFNFILSKKKDKNKIFSKLNFNFVKLQIRNELDYNNDVKKGFTDFIFNKRKSNMTYELNKDSLTLNFFDKANKSNFSYNGSVNFSPFFSSFKGSAVEIDLFSLLNSNSLILLLLKTEILNNKNLNFDLNIFANEIKDYHNFVNLILNSKIEEGLIDIDNTKFSYQNFIDFKIGDSLIYVKNNELVLDGNLELKIKNSDAIFQFLLTPKKYRKNLEQIELDFVYNFDQNILNLNNIRVDEQLSKNTGKILENLILKGSKLENKVYLKSKFNSALKAYEG